MSLTVTQAVQLDLLLRYLLNVPHVGGQSVTRDEASQAVLVLSAAVRQKLGAGITPAEVEAAWPDHPPF